jgi:hypothetical protein
MKNVPTHDHFDYIVAILEFEWIKLIVKIKIINWNFKANSIFIKVVNNSILYRKFTLIQNKLSPKIKSSAQIAIKKVVHKSI